MFQIKGLEKEYMKDFFIKAKKSKNILENDAESLSKLLISIDVIF